MKTVMRFVLMSLVIGTLVGTIAAASPAPENTPVKHEEGGTGPIAVNWNFKNGAGKANLMVNPDGTYMFSGNYGEHKPGKDFDIVLGLKSSEGGVILFRYAGDASQGVQWSKQGKSSILKDDYQTFAAKRDWTAEYHFSESAEGRAKLYEEREQKKKEIARKEREARERHDKQAEAEARAEREREEQRERAEITAPSPSGGSSSSNTAKDVANVLTGGLFSGLISLF